MWGNASGNDMYGLHPHEAYILVGATAEKQLRKQLKEIISECGKGGEGGINR